MTRRSDTTITSAELREHRDLAKEKFRKTPPLARIDYTSPIVAQHFFMANIARAWLEKSKSELRKDLAEIISDPDMPALEFQAAMIAAQQWFSDNAELMQAALARSAVAATSLTASIDRDGDLSSA